MPYMGLKLNELTVQEEKLVQLMASGMSIAAAGRAAGYASPKTTYLTAKREPIQKALAYLREEFREAVHFDRTQAHVMYLDTWTKCDTATEMKNTVDSLCKLHGLHQPENAVQVNINLEGTKQLEKLSDEELLKIAGKETDYLEPQ